MPLAALHLPLLPLGHSCPAQQAQYDQPRGLSLCACTYSSARLWHWRPPLSSRPPAWLAQRPSLAHHPLPFYITSQRPLPPVGFWSTVLLFPLIPIQILHPPVIPIHIHLTRPSLSKSSARTVVHPHSLPHRPRVTTHLPLRSLNRPSRYQFRFESPKNRPAVSSPRSSIQTPDVRLDCSTLPPSVVHLSLRQHCHPLVL